MSGKQVSKRWWLCVVLLMLLISLQVSVFADTIYVSTIGSDDTGNGTQANPYATIQKGVDEAVDGDTVVVARGVYYEEGLVFPGGKDIRLTSSDPDDPAVVATTIIDGRSGYVSAVTFPGDAGPSSVLTGFTIQNGGRARTAKFGADYGGGIRCYGSPTISNNVVTNNVADFGGGIYCENGSPTLVNNVFSRNVAGWGGGINCWDASPWILNNVVSENAADAYGGAMCFWGLSSPAVVNNTITCNHTGGSGGAIYVQGASGTVLNCIVYANDCPQIRADSLTVSYSNIDGGEAAAAGHPTWGAGNIDADPLFADPGHWDDNGTPYDSTDDFWVDGDYHLKSTVGRWDPSANGGLGAWMVDGVNSPCMDAGDPFSDYGNEPQPNGGRVNMGAYGNTLEASRSALPLRLTVAKLDWSHDVTTATISFHANRPARRYYYRLYQRHTAYTSTSNTSATFNGLSHGYYLFVVTAKDENGSFPLQPCRVWFYNQPVGTAYQVSLASYSIDDDALTVTLQANRDTHSYYVRLFGVDSTYSINRTGVVTYSGLSDGMYYFVATGRERAAGNFPSGGPARQFVYVETVGF